MFKPTVLIPVYNHERAVVDVVDAVLAHGLPCLLVDDGSNAACAAVLRELAQHHGDTVHLLRLPENRGKGGAIIAGAIEAQSLGFTHVLQIDADGQHDSSRIADFLALSRAQPEALICGCPVYDDSVPRGRLIGRYLTHVWVWINTLSFAVRDAMCGLRVYPLASLVPLVQQVRLGRRMEFDIEVMVRLCWRGVPVINVPVRVTYPTDGVSHFRMWDDNVRISAMHTRLFGGMLLRAPVLLGRRAARLVMRGAAGAGAA